MQYIRVQVVKAGPDSSAVGASAYISRQLRIDQITGRVYDFRAKGEDLLARGIALPPDAPQWARNADGETLWNAAQDAELLKDGSRFHKDAQLAYSVIIALPKELTPERNADLLHEWITSEYTSKGLAVEWAIHASHERSPDNVHAHLLVSTREVSETGFGKKARGALGCAFRNGGLAAGNDVGRRWRLCQEAFFAARGLEVSVDPLAAVPQLRAPRELVEGRATTEYARSVAEENERRASASRTLLRDPENLLDLVTETHSIFTARMLGAALWKAGIGNEELEAIRDAALSRCIALEDGEGQDGYYTTPAVMADESAAINLAVAIARRSHPEAPGTAAVAKAILTSTLDAEQQKAVEAASGSNAGLTVWRGIAGAGKSRAANAAREAYEAAGWRVIGAAPTNTVARDLENAGFAQGTTIARLLWRLDEGKEHLTPKTLLVVDEAAMVSTPDYLRLLAHVWKGGSRVVFCGDDRQLGPVVRGGLFRVFVETFGCEELAAVRRQRDEAQREATRLLAAGAFRDALAIYNGMGAVQFATTGAEAAMRLVRDWGEEARQTPSAVRFVYARTNAEVNALNEALAAEARRIGLTSGPETVYRAERGDVRLAAGDRIQFRSNDRRLELYNGYCGTVLAATRARIDARLDTGREISFDPREYADFQLGYAGTVYRGQGKTQTSVFALHGSYSDSASAYVALTRHTDSLRLYAGRESTPDLEAMARQMGREPKPGAALLYRPAGGGRTYLDQALGLPELTMEPKPAPEPVLETVSSSSDPESVVAALRKTWNELREAVKDERGLERNAAGYEAELAERFLLVIERSATGDGKVLERAFGGDGEAERQAVMTAISGEAWDSSDPIPGYKPRLFGRGAYKELKAAIASSREIWRGEARRKIAALVEQQYGAKRRDAAMRVTMLKRRMLDRIDEIRRPEHHVEVEGFAKAARAADPEFARAIEKRAERLRLLLPGTVAERRRKLVQNILEIYGPNAGPFVSTDPRREASERYAQALTAWVRSAAPENLPRDPKAHVGEIFDAAEKTARRDPSDAAARKAVEAHNAYEGIKREMSRGLGLGF